MNILITGADGFVGTNLLKYLEYNVNTIVALVYHNSEYLNIINLAKLRDITVLEQLDRNEHLGRIERDKLFILDKKIEEYKHDYDLIDFNDMILKFIEKYSKTS